MKASALFMAANAVLYSIAFPIHKRVSKFAFFGVNESGGEFGSALPGQLGTDYTWPVTSTIDVRNGSKV